jgi:hypothetical protein
MKLNANRGKLRAVEAMISNRCDVSQAAGAVARIGTQKHLDQVGQPDAHLLDHC